MLFDILKIEKITKAKYLYYSVILANKSQYDFQNNFQQNKD